MALWSGVIAGSDLRLVMSVALQSFSEQLSPTLLKRDGVGIGPLLPEDTATMFVWTNDIETTGMDIPYRPMDGVAFANFLSTVANDPARVLFAIRLAGVTQAVGFVLFSSISAVNRSAELGIRIGRENERGRGIGTAAMSLALDYAWTHLNLARVQLKVMADNPRAIRAYAKAGFVIEGRHTHAAFVAGKWHDMLTMASLNPRPE
jgi:RimJ/RimL family protein N-acetyltransferase